MKKMKYLMALTAVLLAMLVLLTGCDGGEQEKETTTGEATGGAETETTAGGTVTDEPVTDAPTPSEGLDFTSNGDGTCYVSGIGTCTDLDVVIPSVSPEGDRVTGIDDYVFRGRKSLTSIAIPDSVISIGVQSFRGCTGLMRIVVDSNNSVFHAEGNCLIETATNTLILGCLNSVIPDGVTSIRTHAFEGCTGLTSIEIPNSVESIGDSAFYGCSGLTSVTISDSVTSIGEFTFSGCTNLVHNVKDGVKYLGNNSNPYLCAMGTDASRSAIVFAEGMKFIHSKAFEGCRGLTSITIPDGVTSIGEMAFFECRDLTSIVLPDGVDSIGYAAFDACTNLAYNVKDGVKYLGNESNPYLCAMGMDIAMTSISLAEGTELVYSAAFQECHNLTSVTLPDSLTSIGDFAFSSCTGLTSVLLPDRVASIGSAVFSDCSGLTSITIPDSVTSIEISAFAWCYDLKSITFKGTIAQWKSIIKDFTWNNETGTYTVHCTDGDISKSES